MKSSRAPQPKLLEEHGSWTPLCWMQGKWISCVTFAGLGGQSQATITRHPAQKSTDLACCPDVLWNVLWNPFGRHASHLLWHQIFCTCHIAANQNGPHWIHGLRSANFGVAPAMWNKDERKMRPRNAPRISCDFLSLGIAHVLTAGATSGPCWGASFGGSRWALQTILTS